MMMAMMMMMRMRMRMMMVMMVMMMMTNMMMMMMMMMTTMMMTMTMTMRMMMRKMMMMMMMLMMMMMMLMCENLKPKRTKNHCKTESEVERGHQESAHFHDPLGSPCPNGLPSFGGPQATGISGTPTIASTSPPNQTSNQLAEHCRF